LRLPNGARFLADWWMVLHWAEKMVIFARMHFSRHISQLHSTSSLMAALLLRVAR